ncbi:hypothetical protein [Streptomyces sp. 900105245]|uniref:Uncharacterized protein n=1 Tax=Streptomyces sp. 900105245 TaxID=3154379 RepID=A0ABV1UJ28_9ACTN
MILSVGEVGDLNAVAVVKREYFGERGRDVFQVGGEVSGMDVPLRCASRPSDRDRAVRAAAMPGVNFSGRTFMWSSAVAMVVRPEASAVVS